MALKSPYPSRISADEGTGRRIQFDVEPKDKADLLALLPDKGVIQLVLLNLFHNLLNDLRKLECTSYRHDASDILDILTQPRPLSDELARQLGRTTIGTVATISSGLLQHYRGKRVREKTSGTEIKSSDVKKRTEKGE